MLRLATLFLLPWALFAQEGLFTLAGSVVDSDSGEPLAHALVTLNGFPVQPQKIGEPFQPINRTALTDASGTFRFPALPAARYTVRAQKPGYKPDAMPDSRLGIGLVNLQSSVEDVRVGLSALGVITGKVVDENGESMRGVGISALHWLVVDGLRETQVDRTVYTDDRGDYRMSGLTPMKYYLKAAGQGGSNLLSGTGNTARLDVGDSFAPVYSGGAKTIGAANPVEIRSGTQATADFRLKLEPAWQIRGTLRNFKPREPVTFSLVIDGEEVPAGPDHFNRETGAFEFEDVVDGSYIFHAVQGENTGEVAVNVAGSDAENAVLALYPPVDIPVTVRYTNPAPPAPKREPRDADDDVVGEPGEPLGCVVFLTPEQITGNVRATGRTIMRNGLLRKVVPGKQATSLLCFDGYIRSALAGTQDLLANPALTISPGSSPPALEILATHGGGRITAKLDRSVLGGLTRLQVLLVPQFAGSAGSDHREAAYQPGGPANELTFAFGNLAPGTYVVYAFGNQDNEYRNPEFLRSLSGGQTVEIDGDSAKEITIDKVIP